MGLFSSSKDKSEHKDASEIKQAAISDSQMNNTQNNAMQQQGMQQQNNVPMQGQQNLGNLQQQGAQQNFVNPFSQQQGAQQQNNVPMQGQQNPFGNSGGAQQNGGMPPADFNDVMNQPNAMQMQNNQQQNPFGTGTGTESQFNLSAMSGQASSSINLDKIQEMIDETVEKIIEDKWSMLEEKVNKVLRWKENKDAEINMLKEDLVTLGEGFNKLEMKLINKISNYDKNILDVNSEIKALEKVFQKVTPTLINNVNELSKIADDFRGTKQKDRKVMTEDDFALDNLKDEGRNSSSKK